MFAAAAAALSNHIPIQNIMENYSFNVLIIFDFHGAFTNLILKPESCRYCQSVWRPLSKGKKEIEPSSSLGILMFFDLFFLNNITAVMMVLPVMFVL